VTPGVPPSSVLHAALEQCGISDHELWVDYIGLGGTGSPAVVGSFLSGGEEPDQVQYDILAQALNERFLDLGMNHPVPYFEDVGQSG
jgi:hypothetical protein